jgi:hypothetical protein
MLFGSVEKYATEQALELAAGLKLPVAAQSKPTNVVRANGCALGAIVVVVGLAVMAVLAAVMAGSGSIEEPRRTVIVVGVLAFAIWVLFTAVKAWRARRSDYVDPQLVVEAGPEGVTIRGPGRSHALRYGEVRATIASISFKQSVRFVGVKMESPAGTLSLDDALFVNGRNVAAAIVARLQREKDGGEFVGVG